MRLARLHLQAFGPFSDRWLDLGPSGRLVLLHGPNEAGKSSTLRAITDLRYGIPQQSRDNFVHAHPDMRIGGVFVDAAGREHAVLRRKGRGATLLDAATLEPVAPAIEAAVAGGLTRDEYDAGFALDHERLRQGGRDLLAGEGEIGAALFEASAGVRSIPQVLDQLDRDARRHFMPGARGRNARINEALQAHSDRQKAYRDALVRPAHWTELFRRHRAAHDALEALEDRRAALHGELLLVRELRAVAPLLATLDHAGGALQALGDAVLLPETAAQERAMAQAGLAAAHQEAALAAAEAAVQQRRLDAITVDEVVLEAAPLLRRLAADAQAAERARTELAEAQADAAAQAAHARLLAARIDPALSADVVLAMVPAPTARAGIDTALRELERARQALAQQRDAARRQADQADDASLPELPSPEARAALRVAQAQLARQDALLGRLGALPGELSSARRALEAALEGLGLADEAALRAARPLPDADIDEAIERERRDATRLEEREARIEQVSAALADEQARRRSLLEPGEVPTADELREARLRREAGWRRLRVAAVDAPPQAPAQPATLAPIADAYEADVAAADRLADALALDSERAARLQSCQRKIAELEADRQVLQREREQIRAARADDRAAWQHALQAAGLPALSPSALRDWQSALDQARAARRAVQALQDELERASAGARALAATLAEALRGTGLATPLATAPLEQLASMAADAQAEIARRETTLVSAAGRRLEFERTRARMQARDAELAAELEAARGALAPAVAALGLAPDVPPEVVRARLGELDALAEADALRAAAQTRAQRAQAALAGLEAEAQALAARLGDAVDGDPRQFVARAGARLESAERARSEHALARQALQHAREAHDKQLQAAAGHERRLAALCEAAKVASPAGLPEAEERSRRRRELQSTLDHASAQLAQASRRRTDELRALLADRDAARLDADEEALGQEQARLDDELRSARAQEEAARHALAAIDGTDAAALEREGMERAAAGIRAALPTWARSRLAHALLAEALARFRERAQAPMLRAAGTHFARITGGEFVRLDSDDGGERPVLLAERRDGARLRVEAMSEGTRDQLYLALRLAALELRRAAGVDLPVVLDDVLMTSDDRRAGLALGALADFARAGQVLLFTHHRHLVDVARACLPEDALTVLELERA